MAATYRAHAAQSGAPAIGLCESTSTSAATKRANMQQRAEDERISRQTETHRAPPITLKFRLSGAARIGNQQQNISMAMAKTQNHREITSSWMLSAIYCHRCPSPRLRCLFLLCGATGFVIYLIHHRLALFAEVARHVFDIIAAIHS